VTTGLFALYPHAIGRERVISPGLRSILLALLATLCAAVVAASTLRPDRPASEGLPQSAGKLSLRQWENPSAKGTQFAAPRDARPEIDALASSIAKRYRIATDATKGLVATAYREGDRIGVDPLLIIAVIAVESRFNPIAESDMGAQGLMQVIPRFHKEHLESAATDSVLDPHANIRLGARVLKDYIKSGGTEVAGLQRYNGSSGDPSNAYAARVLGEKQRLQQAVQHLRNRARA
jgi:soluble lytic murein transglycosylase-like protein